MRPEGSENHETNLARLEVLQPSGLQLAPRLGEGGRPVKATPERRVFTTADAWALHEVEDELARARAKHPGTGDTFVALMEEVGELAQALLQHKYEGQAAHTVRAEAIQVACMAVRCATEGDESLKLVRDARSSPLSVATDRVLGHVARRLEEIRNAYPGNAGNYRRLTRAAGRLCQLMEDVAERCRRGEPLGLEALEGSAAQLGAHALRIATEGDAAFPYRREAA